MRAFSLPFIWRDRSGARRLAPNTWTWLRTEFDWAGDEGDTTVLFAADPTARLWVNGTLVVARVRRFVTPHIGALRVDLAPYLRPGRNVAVVLHHHWGLPNFQRAPGGAPGIAIEGKILRTSARWRWCPAEEFLFHPHQTRGHDGSMRIRFPVVLDQRAAMVAIHQAGMDDRDWRRCAEVRSPAWEEAFIDDLPRLTHEFVAPVRLVAAGEFLPPEARPPFGVASTSWSLRNGSYRRDKLRAQKVALGPQGMSGELTQGPAGYLTLDFGRPVHGFVYFEAECAEAGAQLEFGYGELRSSPRTGKPVLRGNGSFDPEIVMGGPSGDRVILVAGRNVIEVPEERTCRWLLVSWRSTQKPIHLLRIGMHESGHPIEVRGSFHAAGARHIKPLVQLCLDHARVTMSDAYVDTPGREDAQWLEDIEYRAELAARWFGDAGLRQRTLRHAVEQQAADGCFRAFAPDSYRGAEGMRAIDWALTWIGLLHDDWRWTGETTRVRDYFDALTRFLEFCDSLCGPEGLLRDGFCFLDIRVSTPLPAAKHDERHSIVNAWYYGYLRKAATLARAIGRAKEAEKWAARAEKIGRLFHGFLGIAPNERLLVGEFWRRDPEANRLSQAAALSTVFHGVLAHGAASRVMNWAFRAPDGRPPEGVLRWNNPSYAYRALRTLCGHGRGDVASAHLLERYRPYLPDGPLPEYFLSGERQPDDPTGSHGWAAVPLLWLHEDVLGVRLTGAGGARLELSPCRTAWSHVSGSTVTPAGICQVKLDWRHGRAEIVLPAGVTCEVTLPGYRNSLRSGKGRGFSITFDAVESGASPQEHRASVGDTRGGSVAEPALFSGQSAALEKHRRRL